MELIYYILNIIVLAQYPCRLTTIISSTLKTNVLFPLYIIILNQMIVKNRPQFPFSSQKPYFLQGLDHAREILMQLKRQKEHDLSYSPIARKHTKLSSDAIIEEESQLNCQADDKKRETKDANKQKKWDTGKMKLNRHKKMATQSYDEQDNEVQSMQTTKYKFHDSSLTGEQMEINQPQHKEEPCYPQTTLQKNIRQCQYKINEIGNKLEQTYAEIETYEVIFENLCDCYRANQHIYNRNHKLRRQAIRLDQQKNQILTKIQDLGRQSQKMDQAEKYANQFITKAVKNHVSELCAFNQEIPLENVKIQKPETFENFQDSQEEEQTYDMNVKLNYKKLKERYEEKTKKKGIPQPKKLQKGISFEEDIDVMSKYYENQLTHI